MKFLPKKLVVEWQERVLNYQSLRNLITFSCTSPQGNEPPVPVESGYRPEEEFLFAPFDGTMAIQSAVTVLFNKLILGYQQFYVVESQKHCFENHLQYNNGSGNTGVLAFNPPDTAGSQPLWQLQIISHYTDWATWTLFDLVHFNINNDGLFVMWIDSCSHMMWSCWNHKRKESSALPWSHHLKSSGICSGWHLCYITHKLIINHLIPVWQITIIYINVILWSRIPLKDWTFLP